MATLLEGNHDKAATFSIDKYNKPKLEDRKTMVAQAIINACFMVPGNLPGMPTIGPNIKQYFYKEEHELSKEKLKADLEAACGQIIGGAVITGVDFSTQKAENGDTVFLLCVVLSYGAETTTLGVVMKDSQEHVNFKFAYTDDTLGG